MTRSMGTIEIRMESDLQNGKNNDEVEGWVRKREKESRDRNDVSNTEEDTKSRC